MNFYLKINKLLSWTYHSAACHEYEYLQTQPHVYQHTSIFQQTCDTELDGRIRCHHNQVHKNRWDLLLTDEAQRRTVDRFFQSNDTIHEHSERSSDLGRNCQ